MDFLKTAGIKDAHNQLPNLHKTFTEDAFGNLIITYQTIDGSIMHWDKKREQTSVIGASTTVKAVYTRKRLKDPGDLPKYLSDRGQPVRIFVNGLHAYKLFNSSYLVITEGEKKAFVGCANMIPTVGIQGIWQHGTSNRDGAGQKRPQLLPDLLELFYAMPNLTTVYLLFDADCKNGSKDRRLNFAGSILNFQESVSELSGKDFDFYFSHLKTEEKGLDDFLIANPDSWAELADDFYDTNLKSRFLTIIRLPATKKLINSYFGNVLTEDAESEKDRLPIVQNAFFGGQRKEAELAADLLKNRWVYNATTDRWMQYEGGKWHNRDSVSKGVGYAVSKVLEKAYLEHKEYLLVGSDDPKKAEKEQKFFDSKLLKIQTAGYIAGVVKFLELLLGKNELDFDVDNNILNCKNGELCLKTLKLSPHRPESYLAKQANVDFNADAPPPESFLKFIAFAVSQLYDMERDNAEDITEQELEIIEFLQVWAGLCLSGETGWQGFIYAYGGGSNGKTTISRVLSELLGDYAGTMQIDVIMGKTNKDSDEYKIAATKGKRLIVGSEIAKSYPMNEARIKDLTGGDNITARHIYGNPITFKPTAKYFFFGNHKLIVKGQDEGIWRRIFMLEMQKSIPKNIRKDLDELIKEWKTDFSGILNWALEGYQKFLADGKNIKRPAIIEKATKQYQRDSDTLGDFIEEELEEKEGALLYLDDAWRAYCRYVDDRKEDRIFRTKQKFKAALVERGIKVDIATSKRRNYIFDYDLTVNTISITTPISSYKTAF